MQYPGTIDRWYDQSGIQPREIVDTAPRQLFLTAAAFDRGPEKITIVHGEDFYKLYGSSINFAKYGQAAIQAANIIDNGGELMIKRVVAPDATLANAVIVAAVTSQKIQKTDDDGKKLYLDPVSLTETTSSANKTNTVQYEPIMINAAKIKYNTITITDAKSLAAVVEAANGLSQTELKQLIEGKPTLASIKVTVGEKKENQGTNSDKTTIKLSWGAVENATGYKVYIDSEETAAEAADGYKFDAEGRNDLSATVVVPVGEHTYYVNAYDVNGVKLVQGTVDIKDGEEVPAPVPPEINYYPLWVITDTGRGESTKRFGIEPLYSVSKSLSYMLYRFKYLGAEYDSEYETFATRPGVIYLQKSRDLGMVCSSLLQCDAESLEANVDSFYNKIAEITGLSDEVLNKTDILFGKTNRGVSLQNIIIDNTGDDLGTTIGFDLEGGSEGSFATEAAATGGDYTKTQSYQNALLSFFKGENGYDDIFNLDMYKPVACVDADYPDEVKKAIVDLANFRKDFMFFGDLGLDVDSYESAVQAYADVPRSKFAAWYGQTYKIINPFNMKHIRVTITYSIARILCSHTVNSANTPYCGIMHGWTFPEVLEGTINFTPKITPSVNQKQLLTDMQLNYASVLNNVLTMETEYTSQDTITQLSFINNVIAIQIIIKDVRDNCPKYRYSFISTNDLSAYKNNVDAVVNKYTNWFESLEFVYVQDEIMKANKIFEADLKVKHKDFVQSELLNIYVLGTEDATTEQTNNSVAVTEV